MHFCTRRTSHESVLPGCDSAGTATGGIVWCCFIVMVGTYTFVSSRATDASETRADSLGPLSRLVRGQSDWPHSPSQLALSESVQAAYSVRWRVSHWPH
ncbi:conserved protein of unknown function [Pseudomonas marincola]|uniref:Uncharacterized protein n=1 Tax=Pseudomonas marincola TaxID=437900 RepID=A0A653E648_9PSED|nr:conserved protein of unknown function [Pseudomonas marincola]